RQPRVAVRHQHHVSQAARGEQAYQVVGVGLQVGVRAVAVAGQPGQGDRVDLVAAPAQRRGDRVPGPAAQPGAGDQYEGRHGLLLRWVVVPWCPAHRRIETGPYPPALDRPFPIRRGDVWHIRLPGSWPCWNCSRPTTGSPARSWRAGWAWTSAPYGATPPPSPTSASRWPRPAAGTAVTG